MAKTKTPLLSLGSQGSIGNALTTQRRGQATLLRKKPIPAYRRTLPQQYQRWLYEDYAYLWRQQSLATRQAYASLGYRHHLTGYQYWMKYHLTHLPDIAAMYHLDEKGGAIAYDASRNQNHAIIIGASPTTGLINGARLFDGLNDWLNCGHHSSLDITTSFTMECIVQANPPTRMIAAKSAAQTSWEFQSRLNKARILIKGITQATRETATNITDGLNHFLHARYNSDLLTLDIFLDGLLDNGLFVGVVPSAINSLPAVDVNIGTYGNGLGWWFSAMIDHYIIYTRPLDDSEIYRHSLRRYP